MEGEKTMTNDTHDTVECLAARVVNMLIANNPDLVERIRQRESEARFAHTLRMTEMSVSLSMCYGIDRELTWRTGMLHDIAKEMTQDEMLSVAQKYGHTMSEASIIYPAYMHAEVGALIAEHEFGLKDRDALNAIRYHCSGRPDMSMLEKIIFFSDYAEPHRPKPELLRELYLIATTDIDEAIIRSLFERIKYQMSHNVPAAICELSNNIHDYLLGERFARDKSAKEENSHAELLSDKDFNKALEVVKRNGIAIDSVQNIRCVGGFPTIDGRTLKDGVLLRSGSLSGLTAEDADYLTTTFGLSLVIDLRSSEEIKMSPDVMIAGVRYENIPLAELDTKRMDALTSLYQHGETAREKAWYLAEFSKIDALGKMYHNFFDDPHSADVIRRIFQLLLEVEGSVLFHCTSGKDRTGILVAILLYMLGCMKEDIISDYNASALSFFTNAELFKSVLQKQGYSTELQNNLHKILSVDPENLCIFFNDIEQNYGSQRESILKIIGLGQQDLEALRDKYLYNLH